MSRIVVLNFIILVILSCAGNKNLIKIETLEKDNPITDSLEYELVTFDSRFESWYILNDNPAFYRTKEYYESWNKRYVSAWNYNSVKEPYFEPVIGYEANVDYGFELNHRLFYYFQYVENVLKTPILQGKGSRVILFY